MPAKRGKDSKGYFYRWGKKGKKYRYKNPEDRKRAKKKAEKQGRAAYASGYKG